MLKLGDDFRLVAEPAEELRVGREMPRQHLQRDVPVDRRLVHLVDGRHAPLAERRDDAIRSELLSREVFHRPA